MASSDAKDAGRTAETQAGTMPKARECSRVSRFVREGGGASAHFSQRGNEQLTPNWDTATVSIGLHRSPSVLSSCLLLSLCHVGFPFSFSCPGLVFRPPTEGFFKFI